VLKKIKTKRACAADLSFYQAAIKMQLVGYCYCNSYRLLLRKF